MGFDVQVPHPLDLRGQPVPLGLDVGREHVDRVADGVAAERIEHPPEQVGLRVLGYPPAVTLGEEVVDRSTVARSSCFDCRKPADLRSSESWAEWTVLRQFSLPPLLLLRQYQVDL